MSTPTAKELFANAEKAFTHSTDELFGTADLYCSSGKSGYSSRTKLQHIFNQDDVTVVLIIDLDHHYGYDDSCFVRSFHAVAHEEFFDFKDCLYEFSVEPNQTDYLSVIAYLIFKELTQ